MVSTMSSPRSVAAAKAKPSAEMSGARSTRFVRTPERDARKLQPSWIAPGCCVQAGQSIDRKARFRFATAGKLIALHRRRLIRQQQSELHGVFADLAVIAPWRRHLDPT